MSKITKWYHKTTFWQFVGQAITPFVLVGEGAIIGLNLPHELHALVVVCVVLSAWIKYYGTKDDNNDGISDTFQK